VSGVQNVQEELRNLGKASVQFVEDANQSIAKFAKTVTDLKVFVGLGTGASYGLGGEASIKIKEMCLIPSEVFSTLEYRHGPISIADSKAVYAVFVEDNCVNESLSLIKELKALNAKVLTFGHITDEIAEISDLSFKDVLNNVTSLPAMIIPLQLLGAYISIEKGLNPDVPRGLSKAVILK
ncbi:MAG: SIS domain-containing protein, partial [Clostridia bacterium]